MSVSVPFCHLSLSFLSPSSSVRNLLGFSVAMDWCRKEPDSLSPAGDSLTVSSEYHCTEARVIICKYLDKRFTTSKKVCVILLQNCPVILLYCLLIEQHHILYLFKRLTARRSILESLRSDNSIVSNIHDPQDDMKPSNTGRNITGFDFVNPKCILEREDLKVDPLQATYAGRLRKVRHWKISKFIARSTRPHLPFCGIHDEDYLKALITK